MASANAGIVEKTVNIQEDHVKLLRRDDGTTKNVRLIDKEHIHNNKLQVLNQYETGVGDDESASAAGAADSTLDETPDDTTAAVAGKWPAQQRGSAARSLLPLTAVALVLAVLAGFALFKPDLFNHVLRSLLRLHPSGV